MRYRTNIIASAILALLISGCAFTEGQVNLTYTPDAASKNPLMTVPAKAIVLRVEDGRPSHEKSSVGNKRNGFGMVTAVVKSEKEPTSIVYDALAKELSNSGHRIVASSSDAQIGIVVALKRFWTDVSIHFWDLEFIGNLDANVTIQVAKDNSDLLSKPMSSAFRESRQLGTDSAYESALNGVLGEFVRSFSRDPAILQVLGKGPEKQILGQTN
jgi:uncharacterized lipoprotein YajG